MLPIATGRLLTEAYLLPADRVLLIGAAGGYTAAVLAELVAQVVAVESDPALAAQAREALAGDGQCHAWSKGRSMPGMRAGRPMTCW